MQIGLLTNEEIKFIITDSEKPQYKEENLINPAFSKLHIMQVSKNTDLILFYGNNETGFSHIQKLHGAGALHVEFNNKKAIPKTEFSNNLTPFFHYLKIADEIYKLGNLNTEKNTNPELFDLYFGFSNMGGTDIEYKLLLYKNTKIIHNLHPRKEYNKINHHFGQNARGSASYNYSFDDNIHRVEIPYFNHENVMTFKIIIEYFDSVREVTICKILNSQVVKQKKLQAEKFDYPVSSLIMFYNQYEDLSKYQNQFPKL